MKKILFSMIFLLAFAFVSASVIKDHTVDYIGSNTEFSSTKVNFAENRGYLQLTINVITVDGEKLQIWLNGIRTGDPVIEGDEETQTLNAYWRIRGQRAELYGQVYVTTNTVTGEKTILGKTGFPNGSTDPLTNLDFKITLH